MSLRLLLLALLVVGTGCAPPTPGATPPLGEPADDDDVAASCAELTLQLPEAGALGVYTDAILVRWNQVPELGSLAVTDEHGAAVLGELSFSSGGRTLTLVTEEALPPFTRFDVRVTQACADPVEYSFTTGGYGAPMPDDSGLVGSTFALDWDRATWLEPPGPGKILGRHLTDNGLLIDITPTSDLDAGLFLRGARATDSDFGPVQDLCRPTADLSAGADGLVGTADDELALWENPRLSLGPGPIAYPSLDGQVILEEASLEALIHPDGTGFVEGVLRGLLDTRGMPGPGACALVEETIGVSCIPCADGAVECLTLHAVGIRGERLDVVTIVDRDLETIDADPACD